MYSFLQTNSILKNTVIKSLLLLAAHGSFLIFIIVIELTFKNNFFTVADIWFIISHLYIFLVPLLFGSLALLLAKNRWSCVVAAFLAASFFWMIFVLVLYELVTASTFDLYFFWYNYKEVLPTLINSYGIFPLLILILLFLIFWLLWYWTYRVFLSQLFKKKYQTAVVFIVTCCVIVNFIICYKNPISLGGELFKMISTSTSVSKSFYNESYFNYLNKHFNYQFPDLAVEPSSIFGKHIFFIQLESVSSYLINEKVTPSLMTAARQGILFPNFYSNSVQTIRSQENTMCGIPPSLGNKLIENFSEYQIKKLPCLPQLFTKYGYRTFFFKNHKLGFYRNGEFMSNIGFEEIHGLDIAKSNDPIAPWGVREDIYFRRMLNYLDKYKDQPTFIFIAVSATNHFPFYIFDDRYKDDLPYPQPHSYKELIANPTFLQDHYLGDFLEQLKNEYSDASFFIYSDNSTPIDIHPNNKVYQTLAYDENFLTFLLVIPPNSAKLNYNIGRIVERRYSQMDILPTIIDLMGGDISSWLGNSFAAELVQEKKINSDNQNLIITVQPFHGAYLGLIDYPQKYLFDVANNKLYIYDLIKDPFEFSPVNITDAVSNLNLITKYFLQY